MSVLLNGGAANIAIQGWRLPRDQLAAVHDMETALAAIAARERDIAADLEARRRTAEAEGRAEGLRVGQAAAAEMAAIRLAALLEARRAADAAVEAAVVDLAFEVVRRVLGEASPEAILQKAAAAALASLREERPTVLRVHPDMAQAVGALMGGEGGLRVAPDESLTHDDCVFETPAGQVWAGVTVQLERLRQALSAGGGDV